LIFDGHAIAGARLSTTVTVKLHEEVNPAASVTTKVLVVTPIGIVATDDIPTV
jgi:hypothetical protein